VGYKLDGIEGYIFPKTATFKGMILRSGDLAATRPL